MNTWEVDIPHGAACAQRVVGAAECTCGKADALADLPQFYACGSCDHCHPIDWDGDCRDDANRFTSAALDARYGAEGWEEVEMPT